MRLALECRTDMLEMVQPLADFDWVLSHKVLEDEAYAEWYRKSGNLKFVDNSVNELSMPQSIEQMKEAYEKVNGTYIVAPDFLGDSRRTLEAYKECVKAFPPEKIARVIQGKTFAEAWECFTSYPAGLVCVPYDICSSRDEPPWLMGLRRALIISNIPKDQGYLVHLLGFTSLDEFFWYHGNPMVATIDTGIPILLGLEGKDILDPLESKSTPTFNRMEKLELDQKQWIRTVLNIAILRRYLP